MKEYFVNVCRRHRFSLTQKPLNVNHAARAGSLTGAFLRELLFNDERLTFTIVTESNISFRYFVSCKIIIVIYNLNDGCGNPMRYIKFCRKKRQGSVLVTAPVLMQYGKWSSRISYTLLYFFSPHFLRYFWREGQTHSERPTDPFRKRKYLDRKQTFTFNGWEDAISETLTNITLYGQLFASDFMSCVLLSHVL